jgi:predicted nucleic acid-binding protein
MAWPGGSCRRLRVVIILDTNVLSALMRTRPEVGVVSWLDRQPADSIWVTSVTVSEARFGLALLPRGRRRSGLERAFERVLEEDLSNRVLDFDSAAAASAARLAADRHRAGHTVDFRDTLIAGIAQARRATIATRNTRHFEGLDVPVVDPWTAQRSSVSS